MAFSVRVQNVLEEKIPGLTDRDVATGVKKPGLTDWGEANGVTKFCMASGGLKNWLDGLHGTPLGSAADQGRDGGLTHWLKELEYCGRNLPLIERCGS